jgi:hypothetical protein
MQLLVQLEELDTSGRAGILLVLRGRCRLDLGKWYLCFRKLGDSYILDNRGLIIGPLLRV